MMRSLLPLVLATTLAATASAQPLPDPSAGPPEQPPVGARVVLRGVHFGLDTAFIEPVSEGTLHFVAEEILKRPGIRIRVEGHSDATGTEAYNLELSQERADAVRRILVANGVPAEQLEAVGYGESQPLVANHSAEGRAINRRVELLVVEPAS